MGRRQSPGLLSASVWCVLLLTCGNVGAGSSFLRGEVNKDGNIDIADAVTILGYLFSHRALECLDAADVNDDGSVDIADAIYVLGFLFAEGPSPRAPFPDVGEDPTDDTILCGVDSAPPSLTNFRPAPDSILTTARPTIGTDFGDDVSGVDAATARVTLDGIDVTDESSVSSAGFFYEPPSDLADGVHAVSVEVDDKTGKSARAAWSFATDVTPPVCIIDPVVSPTGVRHQVVSGAYTETSLDRIDINGVDAQVDPQTNTFSLSLLLSEGRNHIQVTIYDLAGHVSSCATTIDVDSDPPTGTIVINAGNVYAQSASVRLQLSATDGASQVSRMQFSNDNVSWSDPEPYAQTKEDWLLTGLEGEKTVFARFEDTAGNWSIPVADTIIADMTSPQWADLVPADGAITRDALTLIAASLSDATSGVDTETIRITLDDFDVTVNAAVTASGFSYTPATGLGHGRHFVRACGADRAGNATAVRQWSFVVQIDSAMRRMGSVHMTWGNPRNGAFQQIGDKRFLYAVMGESYTPLVCFEVTDPARPIFVGGYAAPGWPNNVVVHENVVYVPGVDGNVGIFDARDPYTMTGTIFNIGRQSRIKGIGLARIAPDRRYAYLDYNFGAFEVWDFTDLHAPVLLGRCDHTARTGGWGVVLDRDFEYAYVSNGTLDIYDVRNPASPQLAAQVTEPGALDKFAFSQSGEMLFVCTYQGLLILDIRDPANPVVVTRFVPQEDDPYIFDVSYGGITLSPDQRYIYMAGSGGFWPNLRWQWLEPEDPIPEGYELRDLSYQDSALCYGRFEPPHGTRKGGLQIIDVTDLAHPAVVGQYIHPHDFVKYAWLHVEGSYAYAVDLMYGVRTFDISTPTNPLLIGGGHCSGEVDDVYVSGDYAYLTQNLGGGLAIVDISDKLNPRLRSYHHTGLHEYDLAGKDGHIYLSSGAEGFRFGLEVVDVSNPDDPRFVARHPLEMWGDTLIEGNYAYTSFGMIYDVSEATHPRFVGEITSTKYKSVTDFVAVAKCGPYVYLSGATHMANDNFVVADVSNIWGTGPRVLGFVTTPQGASWTASVAIDYDRVFERAYVALGPNGIGIVDVSDPTDPRYLGAITEDTRGHALGDVFNICIVGDYLYASNYYGSLLEFDISTGVENLELVDQVPNAEPVWTTRIYDGYAYKAKLTGLDIISAPNTWRTDFTPPGCVSGLTAVWKGMQVILAWENPGDDDWLATKVVRSAVGTPASATEGELVYDGRAGSCVDCRLDSTTTYYYAAFAYDAAQNYSTLDAAASAHVYVDDPFPPDPVSEFTAVGMDAEVLLRWVNPTADDWEGTVVVRKEGAYPRDPTDGCIVYDGNGAQVVDTGLSNDTTYFYSAFAYDEVPNYSSAEEISQDLAVPRTILFRDDFEAEPLGNLPGKWETDPSTLYPFRICDDSSLPQFGTSCPLNTRVIGSWGGAYLQAALWIDTPDNVSFGTCTISMDILDVNTGGGNVDMATLAFGYVDARNYYELNFRPFCVGTDLRQYVDGVHSLLADFTWSLLPGTGDSWYHVRVDIGAESLTLHVNGSLVFDIQGSTVTRRYLPGEDLYYTSDLPQPVTMIPGRIGLAGWFGLYFDNIVVTH